MKKSKKTVKNANKIHAPSFVASQIGSTFPAVEKRRQVSLETFPLHSSSLAQRRKAVLCMQNTFGNNRIQRLLSSTVNDQESTEVKVQQPEGEPLSQELASHIQSRTGLGSPLDEAMQNEMEDLFDIALSEVRLHTDHEANILNHNLNARAFTLGSDIFFRGDSGPGDKALLAHELTHVVQQSTMNTGGPLSVGPVDDHYERQAESVANQVSAGAKRIDNHAGDGNTEGNSVAGMTTSGVNGGNIQRGLFDIASDIGNWAGVGSLANSALQGADDIGTAIANSVGGAPMSAAQGASFGGITNTLGGITSGLGLVTGGMGVYDSLTRPGTYGLDDLTDTAVNSLSAFSGLTGTLSSLGVGSLAAGGEAGLAATATGSGALGSAGAFGTAGAALGSAGAVAGAGAAGYGLGRLLDTGFGGLMNITGASSGIDRMRGISRPEGQSGDYSISGIGADLATSADSAVTGGLRSIGLFDESRPAYTQTLGWRLAEALPSWLQ